LLMHPLVDELHSIENTRLVVDCESVDNFYR
jgi:hypothetical protein